MESLTADEIRRAVQEALAEDIGSGDVTTLATIPLRAEAKASMVTREPITVAGIAFAEAAFQTLSPAEDTWMRRSESVYKIPAFERRNS